MTSINNVNKIANGQSLQKWIEACKAGRAACIGSTFSYTRDGDVKTAHFEFVGFSKATGALHKYRYEAVKSELANSHSAFEMNGKVCFQMRPPRQYDAKGEWVAGTPINVAAAALANTIDGQPGCYAVANNIALVVWSDGSSYIGEVSYVLVGNMIYIL